MPDTIRLMSDYHLLVLLIADRSFDEEDNSMKPSQRLVFAVAFLLAALPTATFAHFKLLEPTSWIKGDERGDPQKIGPCGGDPKGQNQNLLTGMVTKATGGSKLHLKIQETIYHSGHYRVALAVNSRTELP